MRHVSSIIAGGMLFGVLRLAAAADIGGIDWADATGPQLETFDKAAVVEFVNAVPGNTGHMATTDLRGFRWIDLAGDKRRQLVMLVAYGPCCANVTIYSRRPSGAIAQQVLDGGADLDTDIRDLDGDGKREIILRRSVGGGDGYRGIRPVPYWTAVYRLKNGKYVDASREFAGFYDAEVLPKLGSAMVKVRERLSAVPSGAHTDQVDVQRELAVLEVENTKTLAVLGRDTADGVSKARQWVGSPDPDLVADAVIMLGVAGGPKDELRAAKEAFEQAEQRTRSVH